MLDKLKFCSIEKFITKEKICASCWKINVLVDGDFSSMEIMNFFFVKFCMFLNIDLTKTRSWHNSLNEPHK